MKGENVRKILRPILRWYQFIFSFSGILIIKKDTVSMHTLITLILPITTKYVIFRLVTSLRHNTYDCGIIAN